uniref:Uncharacterized protein n=1 Tax=Romanomermis culicivorax TaxID=13658 RepID=A0A915KFU4_ROMCU
MIIIQATFSSSRFCFETVESTFHCLCVGPEPKPVPLAQKSVFLGALSDDNFSAAIIGQNFTGQYEFQQAKTKKNFINSFGDWAIVAAELVEAKSGNVTPTKDVGIG